MRVLTLNLRGVYFDEIASGTKTEEYRLVNEYWTKRLWSGYDVIEICRGYPKRGDESRRLRRPWLGYLKKTIIHPHFGPDPVEVYAIRVN